MLDQRASGVLLHPTSFPGPQGIGSLGREAFHFVDFLTASKQTLWQVLPLGPTGYGDSPYSTFSSMAGNPLLIDLDTLVEQGDLQADDLADMPEWPINQVDFGAVITWKMPLLNIAAERFLQRPSGKRYQAYQEFCQQEARWLDDYALFMAVKEHFDQQAAEEGAHGTTWNTYWEKSIALREPDALAEWKEQCAHRIAVRKVWQFYFTEQWLAVRKYANERGIQIIGDMPIFVALDSADVWAFPQMFQLDAQGQPTVVAGVPPDYFSETGQRWGNPLYDWQTMQADGFRWWVQRMEGILRLVDIVRVDHFRGFQACWTIPADEPTAVNGEWIEAPGKELFETFQREFGEIPILAEDLGVITEEVDALRDHFQLPGMKLLQGAFDTKEDRQEVFLPHNHRENYVIYTGTHDNNTTLGWFRERKASERSFLSKYLGRIVDESTVSWELIRLAFSSVCRFAIIPIQDILSLDADARMNRPSTASGNWSWRLDDDYDQEEYRVRLAEFSELYGRNQTK